MNGDVFLYTECAENTEKSFEKVRAICVNPCTKKVNYG